LIDDFRSGHGRVMRIPDSLYVHIPFCGSRCSYCDFFSTVTDRNDDGIVGAVVTATLERIEELALRFGVTGFRTVYVGGGTPSALPRDELRRLLSGIGRRAGSVREWTVEANPESTDEDFLDILRGAGVTRLSFGIQSLDDRLLSELGRKARAADSISALRRAARLDFRLSADLIAGVSRAGGLAEELRFLVEEGVEHLSVYDLTLEEGTVLKSRWERGQFSIQGEDEAADERRAADEILATRGYSRYEVSNYALPGSESAHNLVYWRMGSWIGAGPGATGTISEDWAEEQTGGIGAARPGLDGGSLRIEETRSLRRYAAGAAGAEAKESLVSPADSAFEVMMMAFRTREGLDCAAFERRFGLEPAGLIADSLERWKPRIVRGENRIALDAAGLDLLNRFLVDCLAELETTFPGAPAEQCQGF